jgi:tetratricopeptide (TPR) repeat protein
MYNRSREEVAGDVNICITAQTGVYLVGMKLLNIDTLKDAVIKDGKTEINVSINMDENSAEFKAAYYDLERYMIDSCQSMKKKLAASEKQREKSLSTNKEALEYYYAGIDESEKGNYEAAIKKLKKAIRIDPEFAFAWDNLGVCYRKMEKYDDAIDAYNRSLEIDPNGSMPLQNIAIVYEYKKEYDKALKAYERLAKLDKNNPETFYGIGRMYVLAYNDFEKALDNLCKAYNLYIEQKSAFRADAEKVIQIIYGEMKKQGKEDKFKEILKKNNISTE